MKCSIYNTQLFKAGDYRNFIPYVIQSHTLKISGQRTKAYKAYKETVWNFSHYVPLGTLTRKTERKIKDENIGLCYFAEKVEAKVYRKHDCKYCQITRR